MSSRRWVVVGIVCLLGGGLLVALSKHSPISSVDAQQQSASIEQDSSTAEPGQASTENGENSTGNLLLTEVDRSVPDFELLSIDETIWTAETLKGKPWIINFWATWCPPCIEEIPSMNAAYEIVKPQGVGMLAINAGEGIDAVDQFLSKVSIDFPNVLGDMNTMPNWSVRVLPTTIVVNADGDVIYEALGPREWDDEQLLQRVLDLL